MRGWLLWRLFAIITSRNVASNSSNGVESLGKASSDWLRISVDDVDKLTAPNAIVKLTLTSSPLKGTLTLSNSVAGGLIGNSIGHSNNRADCRRSARYSSHRQRDAYYIDRYGHRHYY